MVWICKIHSLVYAMHFTLLYLCGVNEAKNLHLLQNNVDNELPSENELLNDGVPAISRPNITKSFVIKKRPTEPKPGKFTL